MKAKYKRLIEIKPNGESIGKQSEDEIFYQYHTLKYEMSYYQHLEESKHDCDPLR